jgi:uncharacterized MnhB-related membrane protein
VETILMIAGPVFDAVVALTLIAVAVRVLIAPDLFQAIVVFIVFGLLMSLAWTRLHAPDVALAEAAIGAGLTGALFLNALGPVSDRVSRPAAGWSALIRLVPTLVLAAVLALVLGNSLAGMSGDGLGLRHAVATHISQSGASNPVTSVLLNFRAYDTLLEIAVLLLAVAGVWTLGPAVGPIARVSSPPGPILLALLKGLIPIIGIIAGYLLWIGTSAPGGAFQAAAVLSASGVLLIVTGSWRGPSPSKWTHRALTALGFAAFLVVSLGVMLGQRRFLEYPPDFAAGLILIIESTLTISIAAILVALFAGVESDDKAVRD